MSQEISNVDAATNAIDKAIDIAKSLVQESEPQKQKSVVTVGENGLKPSDLDGMWRLSSAYYKAGFFQHFKSPEQVMVAMNMAMELGLQPTLALRQMYVLNGTPHLYGDLPLAAVMKSGLLKTIKEAVYDKDNKEICSANGNMDEEPKYAVCVVERTNPNVQVERSFTISEADKAGLTKREKNVTWKIYTKDMLRYRARSRALKDLFGDVLNGVSIAEFDFTPEQTRDVSTVSEVNDLFKGEVNA